MATTSIKSIKGRIDRVILYIENPNKTENKNYESTVKDYDYADTQGLQDIMDYAVDENKTEQKYFVSGINCEPETARDEMISTMKNFNIKRGTVVALHIYQSFKEGEVTPELAHEIGKKLAENFFNNQHQAVVATHLNTNHIHNHIVVCPINMVTGKRFYNAGDTKYRLRECSDKLCKENNLSVIRYPQKQCKKSYTEYTAEKNGEYTKNGMIRRDIDECILLSTTQKQFINEMKKRGYTFDFSHKYTTVYHPNFPKARRLKTLGENYTPGAIGERIAANWGGKKIEYEEQDNPEELFFDGNINTPVFRDYQTVYVHFVCGITVVKERGDYNRELQRLLGDELIKFDKRVEEQNMLLDNDLYTDEDVSRFRDKCKAEMNDLIDTRQQLRNQLKCAVRADNIPLQATIKSDIKQASDRIKLLRNRITVSERILETEPVIEKDLQAVKEYAENIKLKEKNQDERIIRRSRTNRQVEY